MRYSNIYGPRQISTAEGGVIAVFIDKLLKREKPTIFGDGNQTRDFLYVNDATEAAILAIKAPPGSIYNVGINKEITINIFFKLLSNILKTKIKPIFQPLRPGEIINSRINYSKIKKELGWRPKTRLENGLKITVDWFQQSSMSGIS